MLHNTVFTYGQYSGLIDEQVTKEQVELFCQKYVHTMLIVLNIRDRWRL